MVCFCPDSAFSFQTILSSVSGGNSAEEIESMLKRIKKLKNTLETQNVKIDAALKLGKQLIKDQHYASTKVEAMIIAMVQNCDAFKDEIAKREMFFKEAARFTAFALENEEVCKSCLYLLMRFFSGMS